MAGADGWTDVGAAAELAATPLRRIAVQNSEIALSFRDRRRNRVSGVGDVRRKGRRSARFSSAVSGGVIAESGHNRLRVDDDHGDGAGRQNEGDGRKSNELVHNPLQSKLAGSNITGTAS
jgi:hypothetical protein